MLSGTRAAVIFVITLATIVTWLVQRYLLVPFGIEFMQTIAFILVIAALGVFLPLITTNCCVLGLAILVIQKDYDLIQGTFYALSNAIGFALALVIFAGIREQTAMMEVPKNLKGAPISLITAGILAMAFMGFAGIV